MRAGTLAPLEPPGWAKATAPGAPTRAGATFHSLVGLMEAGARLAGDSVCEIRARASSRGTLGSWGEDKGVTSGRPGSPGARPLLPATAAPRRRAPQARGRPLPAASSQPSATCASTRARASSATSADFWRPATSASSHRASITSSISPAGTSPTTTWVASAPPTRAASASFWMGSSIRSPAATRASRRGASASRLASAPSSRSEHPARSLSGSTRPCSTSATRTGSRPPT